jgi:transposase-like protein
LPTAALKLSPEFSATRRAIGRLTEEQARDAFRVFRFAETSGKPACPRCGSTDVYEYKSRALFKCTSCPKWGYQFSLTSGTPFASKKIGFADLLYIIACFNHEPQAMTANSLYKDLELSYKTVWSWLHRIRDQLAEAAKQIILTDEVEADGCWVGGQNRPSNDRKGPKDPRRTTWRHKHKRVSVVNARQRAGGPVLTFIAKEESFAAPAINRQVTESTVYFTDEGAWGALDKHTRFPVIHDETFATPESCINNSENFNSFFRYTEKCHRKVADRYVDFYAADAAWRIGRSKKAKLDGFTSIMKAMCRAGRSAMAGYHQTWAKGLPKRLCPIFIDNEGSVGGWRQPTSKEWKAMRNGYRKEGEPPRPPSPFDTPSLKSARSDKWNQDFTFVLAEDFMKDPSAVPDRPGAYAILFDDNVADAILAATGHVDDVRRPIWGEVGCKHLYTGEAYGLRTRLRQHLLGQNGPSNLRDTLFSVQWCTDALPEGPAVTLDRSQSEEALTKWLLPRVLIAFRVCGYTKEVEKAILQRAESPLNIQGRDGRANTASLKEMRRRFDSYLDGRWPTIKPDRRPVRR